MSIIGGLTSSSDESNTDSSLPTLQAEQKTAKLQVEKKEKTLRNECRAENCAGGLFDERFVEWSGGEAEGDNCYSRACHMFPDGGDSYCRTPCFRIAVLPLGEERLSDAIYEHGL